MSDQHDDSKWLKSIGIGGEPEEAIDKMIEDYASGVLALAKRAGIPNGSTIICAEEDAQEVANRLARAIGSAKKWISTAAIPKPESAEEVAMLEHSFATHTPITLTGGLRFLVKGMSSGAPPGGFVFGKVYVRGRDDGPIMTMYHLEIQWDEDLGQEGGEP